MGAKRKELKQKGELMFLSAAEAAEWEAEAPGWLQALMICCVVLWPDDNGNCAATAVYSVITEVLPTFDSPTPPSSLLFFTRRNSWQAVLPSILSLSFSNYG